MRVVGDGDTGERGHARGCCQITRTHKALHLIARLLGRAAERPLMEIKGKPVHRPTLEWIAKEVKLKLRTVVAAVATAAWIGSAYAHCDTLDGPVVSAARKALDSGNVSLVLVWVQQNDETEIRKAFDRARAVRKTGGEAKARPTPD